MEGKLEMKVCPAYCHLDYGFSEVGHSLLN